MKKFDLDHLPDAINSSITKDFTQIPNELLRNQQISGKAKALMCLLLSNKDGWRSYLTSLSKMMKEGIDAIRNGIKELETFGYVLRVRYRDKTTKRNIGSFWAYTDIPFNFNIKETLDLLKKENLEPFLNKSYEPHMENHDVGIHDVENPMLIIYNNKNTKKNNIKTSLVDEEESKKTNHLDYEIISPEETKKPSKINGYIKLSHFNKFYKLYPKKVSKGKALTTWEKLCNKPLSKRPKFKELILAVKKQSKSKQWQNKKYIPHPSTWLNNKKWLDELEGLNENYYQEDNKDKPAGNRMDQATKDRIKARTIIED